MMNNLLEHIVCDLLLNFKFILQTFNLIFKFIFQIVYNII